MTTVDEKIISPMQKKVDELKARRAEVMLGGGEDKLEKQRQAGKMTARERIEARLIPIVWTKRVCLPSTAPPCSGWKARRCPPTAW